MTFERLYINKEGFKRFFMNTDLKCSYINSMDNTASIKFGAENPSANTDNRSDSELGMNFDPQAAIDKVVQDIQNEVSKEHNKTAIAVGTGVVLVSLFVALINPRVSAKMVERLKSMRVELSTKIERSKNTFLSGKFYKFCEKCVDFVSRTMSFACNGNSIKDTYFKKICTEHKTFHRVKNKKISEWLVKIDNVFLKITKKPHEGITKLADKLAKYTVKSKYRKCLKRIDVLEQLLSEYKAKLPTDKQKILESKIEELRTAKHAFSEGEIEKRLAEQEKLIGDIDGKLRKRFYDYRHGFSLKTDENVKHINDNLSMWAQDIVKPMRDKVNADGESLVREIVGNNGEKGIYNEISELFAGRLSEGESALLQKIISKSEKSLHNAKKIECENYFDKKRDLMLGSSPTDVISALFGITLGSFVIATAKDKDSKFSRLFKGVIPAFAGIGTSLAMTAMLISGPKGMLIGGAAGGLMSLLGSGLNKLRLSLKDEIKTKEESNV